MAEIPNNLMPTRRAFLKAGTGTLAGLTLAKGTREARAAGAAPDRPNVLFILPDSWRAQALGCMGNPDVQTPHLDHVASEGILFRQTFANSPLCCPARANILTGTYASRNGMVANDLRLRESLTTMSALFSQAGYRTGMIGKWHLDGGPRAPAFTPPGPRRRGFEFWAANEDNHNYFYNWYFRDSGVPIIMTRYEPEVWTDLAVEFLCETQDTPFFLIVSIGAPHAPYVMPEEYRKRYDPETLKVPPNWVAGVRGGGRKDLAGYYAAITAIDDQIGKLMKTLEMLGLKENTIVFFFSDHGEMCGSQGKNWKRFPWEESIRVPGILRWPRQVKGGQEKQVLLSHVDFAPTMLSLCGISVPTEMQGTDLSQVVLGASDKGPSSVFFQIFGPSSANNLDFGWRGVRTQQHLYARTESGPWLLYDLDKDPYEMDNLVSSPRARSIHDEMEALVGEWMHKVGDSWGLDFSTPLEDMNQFCTYRTFYSLDEYYRWAKAHPNLVPGA